MNAQLPPESDAGQHNEAEAGYGVAFEYWPQMLVGMLVAMGVLGISTNEQTRALIWLPPAAFIGWVFLSFMLRPRKETLAQQQATPLEKLGYIEPPALKMAEASATAPVQAAATAETKAEAPAQPAAPVEKPVAKPVPAADFAKADVVILWGSESGNAEGLAEMAESRLNEAGIKAQAVDMGHVKLPQLQACKNILLLTSTWGDGDPPSNAIELWEAFQKEKVDLSNTRFSVLSLGDTAYTQFCKCGKDFDEYLEAQGAKRIFPRRDCDLDFEKPFDEWLAGVTKALQSQMAAV
ncbi:MAG TPA: flavodoxin domain-containing protein [Coleofasciculaceae cyanobacterium]|jgi:flavodoxin